MSDRERAIQIINAAYDVGLSNFVPDERIIERVIPIIMEIKDELCEEVNRMPMTEERALSIAALKEVIQGPNTDPSVKVDAIRLLKQTIESRY